jgi:hypothetical protein
MCHIHIQVHVGERKSQGGRPQAPRVPWEPARVVLSKCWKPIVLVYNSVRVTALIQQVAGGVPVAQEREDRMPTQGALLLVFLLYTTHRTPTTDRVF